MKLCVICLRKEKLLVLQPQMLERFVGCDKCKSTTMSSYNISDVKTQIYLNKES